MMESGPLGLHERVGRVTQSLEEGAYRESFQFFSPYVAHPSSEKKSKKRRRLKRAVIAALVVLAALSASMTYSWVCVRAARWALARGSECATPGDALLYAGMPRWVAARAPHLVVFADSVAWSPKEVAREGMARSTESLHFCGARSSAVRVRAAAFTFDARSGWTWGRTSRRTVRGALGSCVQGVLDFFGGKDPCEA